MRKIVIFLVIGTILVLLLGSAKPDLKLEDTEWDRCGAQYWQKTTDYQIIRAADLDTLQQKVKEQLKYGLRPVGDISHFDEDYCQVMVMVE